MESRRNDPRLREPSIAPTAQSTSVDIPGPSRVPATYSISPIKQPVRKMPTQKPKKTNAKRSTPKKPNKYSKQSTAQKKLTPTKLATFRQSQDFANKQRAKIDLSKINSQLVKKFKVKARTPNNKDDIIITSSSPTDFMSSPTPQANPIISTITKSPTGPNPSKRSADPIVREHHVETIISNLPLTPPNVEPEIIDLVESPDNPTRPDISIQPPPPPPD